MVGSFSVICPLISANPACGSVDGLYSSEYSGCTMIAFSPYNITCSCRLSINTADIPKTTPQSVQFVSMLKYTASNFIHTWESAGSLSASSVQKSWKVLVTVAAVCIFSVLGSLVGYEADKRAEKKIAMEKSSIVAVASSNGFKAQSANAMIENSLPNVLKETPFMERLKQEIKVYHRWFGVVFFYSSHFLELLE